MAVGRYGSGEPGTYPWLSPVSGADDLPRYQRQITHVYPGNYVGHNRGAAFLYQASKAEEWVFTGNIQALFDAAPEPKTLRWYEGGHMLGCLPKVCDPSLPAFAFHRAWLQKNV